MKRADIKPVLLVRAVTKEDQLTGRILTEGIVRDVLTVTHTSPRYQGVLRAASLDG